MENQTRPTKASVAAFIGAIANPIQRADAKALVKLMREVACEKPKMWGPAIIGFGSYHYKYETGREGDMLIVGFSPRKAATVLYGLSGSSGAGSLLAKLGKHTGKSCLYIKKLADVDHDVLKRLIESSVKASRAKS